MNRSQNNKVKLTDLCPQEKAKIGELIKSLETVKSQSVSLKKEIQDLRLNNANLHLQIQNLKSRLVQETITNQQHVKEIKLLREYHQQQQKNILQINQQSSLQIPTISIAINTNQLSTNNAYIQTTTKIKKQKNKLIQTQYQLQPTGHTKSFERIMNSKVEFRSKHSSKSNFKQVSQFDNQINEQLDKQHNQKQQEVQQSDSEDDFDELAKKWLQLKQKNMNKVKQQYRNTIDRISQPQIQKQQDIPLNTYSQEFDEMQLNKILKSDNFRASRLMKQKQSENIFPNNGSISRERQKNRSSKTSYNKSRTVDFYQTDLLDLVAQIDKQK